jgi:hypothetical protein
LIDVGAGGPAVVRLDPAELPGGEGCRLTVAYCDGIRTVTASSEPIAVEPRPATPVIVTPTPGMELHEDGWLSLEGRLDGDGDPRALEWLLDGEPVGSGDRGGVARPGAGTRTITLRHEAAYASVEIVVRPVATKEMQSAPWAPPWRSRKLRSVGVR